MVNHTYAESGIYYVTISGTTEKLSGRLTNKTVAPAILEVRQWGKLGMTTLDYAFANTSLVTVPQPEEDAFATVTTVENMFSGCTKLETVPEGLLAGAPEITDSTGVKPRFLGKPWKETVDMVAEITGYQPSEMAFVGDRLYTDVATGVNNGAKGFLVLTGEADMQTVAESDVEPTCIYESLKEMKTYL